MSVSPRDPNAEIFLANSQGWKEEAEAVIKDVKDQVKDIFIAEKLEVLRITQWDRKFKNVQAKKNS